MQALQALLGRHPAKTSSSTKLRLSARLELSFTTAPGTSSNHLPLSF